MAYNGELKELFHDLDKRITLSDSKQETLWSVHDEGAKTRESYIHSRFHDVVEVLATIKALLYKLPCEGRNVRYEWIDSQLKCLWWIVGLGFSGILGVFVVALFNGRLFG
jgi:hypothetical protein